MLLMSSAGYALGQSGKVDELKQMFFICEAWMSTTEEGRLPDVRPSQDLNRKEILLISHLAVQEHRTRLVVFEMVRDAEGHLVDLRESQQLDETEDGRIEHPLLDAFADGFHFGMRGRAN